MKQNFGVQFLLLTGKVNHGDDDYYYAPSQVDASSLIDYYLYRKEAQIYGGFAIESNGKVWNGYVEDYGNAKVAPWKILDFEELAGALLASLNRLFRSKSKGRLKDRTSINQYVEAHFELSGGLLQIVAKNYSRQIRYAPIQLPAYAFGRAVFAAALQYVQFLRALLIELQARRQKKQAYLAERLKAMFERLKAHLDYWEAELEHLGQLRSLFPPEQEN